MESPQPSLAGRVALVTGAGQNVGKEIGRALASAGGAVAINDLVGERAEAVVREIRDAGGRAHAVAADVTDPEAMRRCVADTETALGPVDILVNNAGLPARDEMSIEPFHVSTPGHWEPWIRVNLYGVLHAAHAVIEGMRARRHGRIVTIVSNAGRVGDRSMAVYGAAKAAAMGFSRCLALENAHYGVTCNCVSLGTIEREGFPEAQRERQLSSYPVGRLGLPEDVAPVVLYLASDAASWVTAQTWVVDGGNAPS